MIFAVVMGGAGQTSQRPLNEYHQCVVTSVNVGVVNTLSWLRREIKGSRRGVAVTQSTLHHRCRIVSMGRTNIEIDTVK
jgi:hypothetical protein